MNEREQAIESLCLLLAQMVWNLNSKEKVAIVDTHKLSAAIETLESVLKINGLAMGGEQCGNRECVWDALQWLNEIKGNFV